VGVEVDEVIHGHTAQGSVDNDPSLADGILDRLVHAALITLRCGAIRCARIAGSGEDNPR
jgi:hypothetical protein